MKEVKLLLSGIEGLALVLSLLQDLGDDLSRNLFILLNLFEVNGPVLGGYMHNTKLSLVASLRQLPLLIPLKVVYKGLLLHDLEGLELDDLSEHVLIRLGLKKTTILGVRGELLVALSQVQQRVGGILREL